MTAPYLPRSVVPANVRPPRAGHRPPCYYPRPTRALPLCDTTASTLFQAIADGVEGAKIACTPDAEPPPGESIDLYTVRSIHERRGLPTVFTKVDARAGGPQSFYTCHVAPCAAVLRAVQSDPNATIDRRLPCRRCRRAEQDHLRGGPGEDQRDSLQCSVRRSPRSCRLLDLPCSRAETGVEAGHGLDREVFCGPAFRAFAICRGSRPRDRRSSAPLRRARGLLSVRSRAGSWPQREERLGLECARPDLRGFELLGGEGVFGCLVEWRRVRSRARPRSGAGARLRAQRSLFSRATGLGSRPRRRPRPVAGALHREYLLAGPPCRPTAR